MKRLPVESLASGTCAALGSAFAKLALDGSAAKRSLQWTVAVGDDGTAPSGRMWALEHSVRILAGLLAVGANCVMLKFWMAAMRMMTALNSTVVSFVANFVVSAGLGVAIFGERDALQPRWLAGAVLMLCGVWLIALGRADDPAVAGKVSAAAAEATRVCAVKKDS
eukprot:GHVU01077364.1.p3 GENE.GHVU01077364.1~~GHVU01077364.1.p3  ORF type:complete len:166 (-),score=21.71 GHVU01077364.1:2038-2535(-)